MGPLPSHVTGWAVRFIPVHLKAQGMCIKVVVTCPWQLKYVPDRFKAQEMCIKSVEVDPWLLYDVPDHFKTQEMCHKVVRDYLLMTIMFTMIMR